MNDALDFVARIVATGVGATLILDGWSLFLRKVFGVPFPSYRMIGRWVGHFGKLRFRHKSMAEAAPIAGEGLIGWTTHYVIGVGYAALLVAGAGQAWLGAPTMLPALAVGLATVAAPFFVMQPAMGGRYRRVQGPAARPCTAEKSCRPHGFRLRTFPLGPGTDHGLIRARSGARRLKRARQIISRSEA